MDNIQLATDIARHIFAVGDEPSDVAHRIEFKGGKYPDAETALGGFCEPALADHILKFLTNRSESE